MFDGERRTSKERSLLRVMTFRKALAKVMLPPIRFPDSTSLRKPVLGPTRGQRTSTSYSERNRWSAVFVSEIWL